MFVQVRTKLILPSLSKALFTNFSSPVNKICNASKVLKVIKTVRFKHSIVPGMQYIPPGSKYIPPNPIDIAESSIMSALKNNTTMSDEDWEEFKLKIFDQENVISEENFSSIVMNSLLQLNKLDLSRSFLKYVEKCDIKPNFLTYLKYISLCSKNRKIVEQKHILEMINKVRSDIDACPVLDNKRAEYIIEGLCATDEWKDSFRYIDKLYTGKPSHNICSSLACAAIRNNDETLAWEILTKWIDAYETVDDVVIQEFLEYALKLQMKNCFESDKFLDKLFHYMQKRDVIVNMDVAKLIELYFKSHRIKWSVVHTKVTRRGVCKNCRHHLHLNNLKDQDFADLREAFLQRSVMKSDIYINTTAREFRKYMEFIDLYKPFHIVLDGLNAAYSHQGFLSKKNLSMHLLKVVKKLAGTSRKLLVVGRKHMQAWPSIQRISEKAHLFFTDNISQDDPFIVYAALASGPNTLFLSDDLLRDHYSRLDNPRFIHLFKRWQLSHQIFLNSNEYNEVSFTVPVKHSITIQGNMEKGWHIPFDDKIILDPYEELNNWLCIEKCF